MHEKIALVTGASSGIGRAISIELSKQGYDIIICSRNEELLKETSCKILEMGQKSYPLKIDVTNPKSIENLFNKSKEIGFISVVVNNAGFGKFDKIQDINLEDWDNQLSVNLRAPFLITKLFCKPMIKKKEGILVYINSIAGKKGYPYSSAYVASKFGLLGFSKSIREELRQYNIKVISVHPGAVDTAFWNNITFDFPKDEMMSAKNVAKSIVYAISAPGNIVLEELDIQRIKGDF